MSIAFNIKTIPLDGNVERILKRTLYLKKQNEISKDYLKTKINFFGLSDRASDYSQAIMEIGALVCKPKNPSCFYCPISKNCKSYIKNDFEIKTKIKFNKIAYLINRFFFGRIPSVYQTCYYFIFIGKNFDK